MLQLGVISLFPDMFSCLNYGVTGRAIERGIVRLHYWNPRTWGLGLHRQVDDKPYGGGPGMVMMYEPLQQAVIHAKQVLPESKLIYLSPQGKIMQQAELNHIAKVKQPLLFLAGRYEGIDERFVEDYVDEEWSLGNFILSGGELAAMVYIDAIIRLLPGCLGNEGSAQEDSFMNGLLDYPHYTRPCVINNKQVPDFLISGNHRDVNRWRRKQALGRTWLKKPELLTTFILSAEDELLLNEFINEHGDL